MVHGLFGQLSNYAHAELHMASDANIFVPQLPLYSHSDTEPSIEALSIWLQSYVESRCPEGAVLVGNSLGGQLAIKLAAARPDLVHALVLACSAGLGEVPFGMGTARRFDREFIREKAAQTFYRAQVDDALVDFIMDITSNRVKLNRLIRIARSSQRFDVSELLGKLSCPVQVIWGANDSITPPEIGWKFARYCNGEMALIEECGHAPMMERPDRFYSILNEFIHKVYESEVIL